MKKLKLFSAILSLVVFTACDKEDAIINNTYDGSQVGVGFTTSEVLTACGWNSGTSVGVKSSGATIRLGVQSTIKTDIDRSIDILVNSGSTAESGHYSVLPITIPAGSYNGTTTVEFFDDGSLIDGLKYNLILDIDLSGGLVSHTSSQINLTYNKYELCNNYVLTLNEDDGWGGERTWEVTNEAGTVLASGGPYTDGDPGPYVSTFSLSDGAHTLTLYDSYGDGQWNGSVAGSYNLVCGSTTVVSGGGNWGSSDSTDFCVNP